MVIMHHLSTVTGGLGPEELEVGMWDQTSSKKNSGKIKEQKQTANYIQFQANHTSELWYIV
jgi:hypothetical protein